MATASGERRHTAPRTNSVGCTALGDSAAAMGLRVSMHLGSATLAQRGALQERHRAEVALLLHTPEARCLSADCHHLSGASTSPSPYSAAVFPLCKISSDPGKRSLCHSQGAATFLATTDNSSWNALFPHPCSSGFSDLDQQPSDVRGQELLESAAGWGCHPPPLVWTRMQALLHRG